MRENVCDETIRLGAERKNNRMKGFSLIELIIVVVIITILTAISIPYIYSYKKLYKSEDQALKLMDLMREAEQLSVTKRRTFRLEIDRTVNRVLIIDEKDPGPNDDVEIKAIPLEDTNQVRLDQIPPGVTRPNPPNYADAVYAADTIGHLQISGTRVTGNNVWAARFIRDGSVVNSSNVPISATLYLWIPSPTNNAVPQNLGLVRAITIFGGSGAVKYWKHNGTTFLPNQ